MTACQIADNDIIGTGPGRGRWNVNDDQHLAVERAHRLKLSPKNFGSLRMMVAMMEILRKCWVKEGEYALSWEQLAHDAEVSKTTAREACKDLKSNGWIDIIAAEKFYDKKIGRFNQRPNTFKLTDKARRAIIINFYPNQARTIYRYQNIDTPDRDKYNKQYRLNKNCSSAKFENKKGAVLKNDGLKPIIKTAHCESSNAPVKKPVNDNKTTCKHPKGKFSGENLSNFEKIKARLDEVKANHKDITEGMALSERLGARNLSDMVQFLDIKLDDLNRTLKFKSDLYVLRTIIALYLAVKTTKKDKIQSPAGYFAAIMWNKGARDPAEFLDCAINMAKIHFGGADYQVASREGEKLYQNALQYIASLSDERQKEIYNKRYRMPIPALYIPKSLLIYLGLSKQLNPMRGQIVQFESDIWKIRAYLEMFNEEENE